MTARIIASIVVIGALVAVLWSAFGLVLEGTPEHVKAFAVSAAAFLLLFFTCKHYLREG